MVQDERLYHRLVPPYHLSLVHLFGHLGVLLHLRVIFRSQSLYASTKSRLELDFYGCLVYRLEPGSLVPRFAQPVLPGKSGCENVSPCLSPCDSGSALSPLSYIFSHDSNECFCLLRAETQVSQCKSITVRLNQLLKRLQDYLRFHGSKRHLDNAS